MKQREKDLCSGGLMLWWRSEADHQGICVPTIGRCTKYTKYSQTVVFLLRTWLNKSSRRTHESGMKAFFPILRIREQICLCLPHQGLYNLVSEAVIITLCKTGMWWRDRKKYQEKLQVSCVVLLSKTTWVFGARCVPFASTQKISFWMLIVWILYLWADRCLI